MRGMVTITHHGEGGSYWGPLQGFLFQALMAAGVPAAIGGGIAHKPRLEQLGVTELPAVTIDDEIVLQGREPTIDDCHDWLSRLVPDYDRTQPFRWRRNHAIPRTLDAAVAIILRQMKPEDLASLAAVPENDLLMFHPTWGLGIRNGFEMWFNPALVESCGCADPDDASGVIIRKVWEEARRWHTEATAG